MSEPRRALLVLENEGLPRDRRVWDEARTLHEAGWQVTAICPAVRDEGPEREVIEGISVRRFRPRFAGGAVGYVREYATAYLAINRLTRELADQRFDVVGVANPPDFLGWAVRPALARGARLIFDQHDLTPELYRSRFGGGPVLRALLALERRALRGADAVIVANEAYRRLAIERAGVDPEDVYVVRNGPDLERFRPVAPDPELRRGRRHLIAYLGVMGPQDGIDHALAALAELRRRRGRDWRAIFIGDGEVLGAMRRLARQLGIAGDVEFAGWRGDDDIRRILATADVCLAPDPPSPLNVLSSMVKVPEYMAMGRPIASYDLPETRAAAGDAAAYADSPEPAALGRCIDELLSNPGRRARMAYEALRRVERLSWERSARILLRAYEDAAAAPPRGPARELRVGSRRVAIGHAPDGARQELG
ncbi:MAG TPA: glycosyltransferase family 4 protein [Solirubrobacterales bacterium]|jgi:glycosyltransferase involved in cell wall biosynthesis